MGKFLPKIAFIEPEHLFIYIDRGAALDKINFKADFLIIQDVAPKNEALKSQQIDITRDTIFVCRTSVKILLI